MAGDAYGPLIASQVAEERALKSSIEVRATTVITSSGVLVTLLFGLRAVVEETGGDLGTVARWLLAGSLVAFVTAALGAIVANRPRDYEEVSVDGLARLTCDEYWTADHVIGAQRSAEVLVDVLRMARESNQSKAAALSWAFRAQLVAVGLLSAALALELMGVT